MLYGEVQESEARAHDAFREDGSPALGEDPRYRLHGAVLDANPEACRILRCTREDAASAGFDSRLALGRSLPNSLRRTL